MEENDYAPCLFDSRGRIPQVEYATKAAKYSGTALAMKGRDGVVFALEHIDNSALEDYTTSSYSFTVDDHIGIVSAGLRPDVLQIVNEARKEASTYRSTHDSPIPLKRLMEYVGAYMYGYTQKSALRPFGATLIFGSYENDCSKLFKIDSSGEPVACFGWSTGKQARAAESKLVDMNMEEMAISDLIREAVRILNAVNNPHDNIQRIFTWTGQITEGKHTPVPNDVLQEAIAFANNNPMSESDEDTLDDEDTPDDGFQF